MNIYIFMSVRNLRIGFVVFKATFDLMICRGYKKWVNFRMCHFFLQCIFVYFYNLLATPSKLVSPFFSHQLGKEKNKKKKKQKEEAKKSMAGVIQF